MAALRWSEQSDQFESLAACLRAVLAGNGRDVAYDELVAALGLGAAIVAVRGEPPDEWGSVARDAALLSSAELYGLRLRDLHPPDAARGLDASAEFALHFVDSYVPLIRRALENGQLALAWRGWPPPRQDHWGVITAVRDDLVVGHTLRHGGEPLPLVGPAHQVYVVEEFAPPARWPQPGELLGHAAGLAERCWAGKWSDDPAILSGAAAYDCWSEILGTRYVNHAPGRAVREFSAAVAQLTAARRSLVAWLHNAASSLSNDERAVARAWEAACEDTLRNVAEFASTEFVQRRSDCDRDGREFGRLESLTRAIQSARKAEAAFYTSAELQRFARQSEAHEPGHG